MTKKNDTAKTVATQMIVIGSVLVVGSAIGHALLKRQEKREIKELRARNAVAHASFMEVAELFIENLDEKIRRARQALDDDEFNEIIKDF